MSDLTSEPDADFPPHESEATARERRAINTRGRTLREHATRGVLITSAFQVGLAGIGLARRLLVAAFLTQEEYGLWGILMATLLTLMWLKQIGIADKFIQQNEEDQETAYQKAFTLEAAISIAFFVLVIAVLPLYAAAYGHPEMILPGVVLALTVPLSALETPIWIAYRDMQFVKQRVLAAIDPVVAFVVTVVLGILGFDYWALVAGAVVGTVCGALAATLTSPYRMRLRYDRGTLSEYTKFSLPLFGLGLANMITVQGTFIIANRTVGLVGVGAIGLASTIASFADRVDGIVSQTIYPAVCSVADRRVLLAEAFVKSNRVILMWAIPFSVGLALFAGDLVKFVLGEQWESAVDLLVGIGLIVGASQIAFNWSIFMRAVNDTKPLFIASLVSLGVFAIVMIPALLTLGLDGYVVGLAVSVAAQIAFRGFCLRKLFPGFKVLRHSARAIAPVVPAAAAVLLLRLLVDGDRTLALALGELALYALVTIVATVYFERALVKEMTAYLRGSVSKQRLAADREAAPQGA